jgi:hypothetical protein
MATAMMKLVTWCFLLCSCHAAFFNNNNKSSIRSNLPTTNRMATTELKSRPFAVVVQAEILGDRMDEFLTLIQTNAENTRKEPGCIRFGT